jgi:hypothetical protein
LDHLFIFNGRQLEKVLADYLDNSNHWRPHRSIGQRAPCPSTTPRSHGKAHDKEIIAKSVLGGLHHVYQLVA